MIQTRTRKNNPIRHLHSARSLLQEGSDDLELLPLRAELGLNLLQLCIRLYIPDAAAPRVVALAEYGPVLVRLHHRTARPQLLERRELLGDFVRVLPNRGLGFDRAGFVVLAVDLQPPERVPVPERRRDSRRLPESRRRSHQ